MPSVFRCSGITSIHYLTLRNLWKTASSLGTHFLPGQRRPFHFLELSTGVYAFDHGVGVPHHLKSIDQIAAEAGYNTAFIGEAIGFITPFFGYGRNTQYSKNLMELSPWPGDTKRLSVFMKETGAESHESKGIWNQLRNYLLRTSNSELRRILATISRTLRFIQFYTTSNLANYRFKTRLHERFMVEIEEFFRGIFAPPQFVWIHSMITHEPYLPPANTVLGEPNKLSELQGTNEPCERMHRGAEITVH